MRNVVVMSKATHENHAKFFGVCLLERPLCMITEFCERGTMFRFLHEEDEAMLLSWSQNLKMCLDVAGATNYLHSFHPQIVHETSVLGPLVPVVKVSDFGMARMKQCAF